MWGGILPCEGVCYHVRGCVILWGSVLSCEGVRSTVYVWYDIILGTRYQVLLLYTSTYQVQNRTAITYDGFVPLDNLTQHSSTYTAVPGSLDSIFQYVRSTARGNIEHTVCINNNIILVSYGPFGRFFWWRLYSRHVSYMFGLGQLSCWPRRCLAIIHTLRSILRTYCVIILMWSFDTVFYHAPTTNNGKLAPTCINILWEVWPIQQSEKVQKRPQLVWKKKGGQAFHLCAYAIQTKGNFFRSKLANLSGASQ